ncbi:MAG: MBOAT family protein [Anaerolineales bacterium]|nr:MBOAT family protein [Anaerolineales bacterium]
MLLHTASFLLFLLGVTLLYWRLPAGYRKPFLLAASYAFYATFDLRFLALLIGLTLMNFYLGRGISYSRYTRLLSWVSVILNLGILGVFKWANFFIDNLRLIFQALGMTGIPIGLELLLPIGISFYSFQAIAYTTEIYRKKISPAPLLDLAVYMAFFPKLLSGPLVRPPQFLNQLSQPASRPDRTTVQAALSLLLVGLVKKVVIADSLASICDVAFRAAAREKGAVAFPGLLYWQGFYLYSFLIYTDFSGYTDIARASAAFLGFDLPENFKQPYLSENITIFWNRWHMTMTQWFREYLFFPLSRILLIKSGRRYARQIQIIVTLLTMTLIGVWQSAAWTFVAWGVWHGILLIVNQQLNWRFSRGWQKFVLGLVTFHLVGLGWVFFGSDTLETARNFVQGMLHLSGPLQWVYYLPPVILCAFLVLSIDLVQGGYVKFPARLQSAMRPIIIVASIVVLVCLALVYQAKGGDVRPFIYGQF